MSLKRKAVHGAIPQSDTPDNKRRRGPDLAFLANVTETPQRTTQAGLEFLERLKQAKDKSEHLIATHFHILPDPDELPEYYQVIHLPIALETIEAKLRRFEYPNMSAIEADLKRMITNAKTFNEKNSEVHNDAEKIRKLVSNQFKEINPAYVDPNYTALPTPLPGEVGGPTPVSQAFARPPPPTPTPVAPQQTQERPKRTLNLRGPKDPRARDSQTPTAVATPTPQTQSQTQNDFSGKTFQQAQEQILQELIDLKNEDDELIAGVFMQLPSRSLKDYYAAIKSPESLLGAMKKATGRVGHKEPTGVSLMKTWADYEHQVGFIWRNAYTYNEDGSEISNLAGELEKHFNKRVAEAKAVIPDPNRPKVKLNMTARSPEPPVANPRITLNVGPKPSPQGVAVDAEALKRQQEMIKSVTHVPGRPPSAAPDNHVPPPVGMSQSPMPMNGIKPEVSTPAMPGALPPRAPEMNGGVPNGHAMVGMPPPAIAARPPSASPYPPVAQYYPAHNMGLFETRVRAPGKTAADALILSLDFSSHPSLKLSEEEKVAYRFTPSDKLTHQSFTFTLSTNHSFIRIQPTIQTQLGNRTYKVGVMIDTYKVKTVQEQYGRHLDEHDPRRPVYDLPLQEGRLYRIEVWMLACPARGAPKIGPGAGSDMDFEKYTFFVTRQKATA